VTEVDLEVVTVEVNQVSEQRNLGIVGHLVEVTEVR
jgi:hypothetical protein